MVKENLFKMIEIYREEFEKLSLDVQKHEQLLDSLKLPCQLHLLTSSETKTHLLLITHFPDIEDKTIEVIPVLLSNYIEQIEKFEKSLLSRKYPDTASEQLNRNLSYQNLVGFGRDVRERRGLLYEQPAIGMKATLQNDASAWHLYGNLTDFNFENAVRLTINGYKAAADQAKEKQNPVPPPQITESVPDSVGGLGTYFYPPILVGEIKPTIRDEIENKTHELVNQKAMIGELEGINFVISKGGLIGLETKDYEKAENIFNVIMGTAILMGLPLHALKHHEIAEIAINKQSYSVTSSRWSESTFRMLMFSYMLPSQIRHHSRTKITIKDLENILEKTKILINKGEQLNKLKLVSGAYTHLDNNEFSQSFIMSWTIVEIYIHELWNKKMQSAGLTKKIREDLDRWDFYRVLEVLHLDKVVSNDDYYELKQFNVLRNDIIHDGHEVTQRQASQCYDMAKNIVRSILNVTQEIQFSEEYMRF